MMKIIKSVLGLFGLQIKTIFEILNWYEKNKNKIKTRVKKLEQKTIAGDFYICKKMYIPKNRFSRPGTLLKEPRGFVWHYTQAKGGSAEAVQRYFTRLQEQIDRYNNDIQDGEINNKYRYAGAHFIYGLNGEILNVIPENEKAYHVGAHSYQTGIVEKFTNDPNDYLLGGELCIDREGNFTPDTLAAAIDHAKLLNKKYNWTLQNHYRHFDITGKICPEPFVSNPEQWEDFLDLMYCP